MQRYKPELSLAALLLALFLAICFWQAPGRPLARGEVDAFVRKIAAAPMPEAVRKPFLQRLRAWGEADDGKPVYMLNLMRYHEQLQPWPGVRLGAGTPRQANDFYEDAVFKLAASQGLSLTVGSEAQGRWGGSTALLDAGAAENWTRVLVVRYPSRRAFFELVSNPEYLKVMPYKFAALDVTLVPTDGATVTPDVRLLAGAAMLLILLGFGWLRAARGKRQ